MVHLNQYNPTGTDEIPDTKFSPLSTHTAIARIAGLYDYPDLSISPEILEAAKLKTISILESFEAMKLLKEIDFSNIKPTNEDLGQIYYLGECCNFSDEYIDYLDIKNLNVIFLQSRGFLTETFLNEGKNFYSPYCGILELDELEIRGGNYTNAQIFDSISLKGALYLISLQDDCAKTLSYISEPIILGNNTIHIVENGDEGFDILNQNLGYIQTIGFKTSFMKDRFTLRMYLDDEKSLFIDYDGENFTPVQKLDNRKVFDLSDTEDKIVPTKFN